MKKREKSGIKQRLLAAFFIVMAVFTIISRIYDSVTIPKVTATVPKRKTVEALTEGIGTVKVKEKEFCRIVPGLSVRRSAVIQGSQVNEGDVLFWYNMEDIAQLKEQLLRELEEIDLAVEKEQISQESYGGLTAEEEALWELDLAVRELEKGQQEFEDIKADHEAELERLKEAYERGLDLAEEELWQQQDRDWESARQNLDAVRNSREEALTEQEREIEDLEEELDSLPEEEEKERARLEKQLKRAREDLEDKRDFWKDQVDSARSQLDYLDYQGDRIASGQTDILEARKESYEAAVKQEEERMKNAKKDLENLTKAVETARHQAEKAKKQDQARQISEDQKKRISLLAIKELEMNRSEKKKELEKITELADMEGAVRAFMDGTVADMELTEGKTTTGEELLSIAAGSSQFEGTFIKEEQELTVGDVIEISIPGTERTEEVKVSRMNLLGDTEGIFQADLDSRELALGTVTSYSCRRQSDVFNKVIPLEGLRKDTKGYYCLVVRPVSTILGEEFRAERVAVEVLYRGYREAAIEGSIFEGDKVITGENKSIGEGDRVRPVS